MFLTYLYQGMSYHSIPLGTGGMYQSDRGSVWTVYAGTLVRPTVSCVGISV